MPIYFACLLAVVVLCSACGKRHERVSSLIVLLNGIANEAYVRLSGDYTPWLWWLTTDTIACFFLTSPERIFRWDVKFPHTGIIGAILAATYATQIIMHLSFGVSGSGEPITYWQSLTAMAWLQLLVLFVGGITHGCRRILGGRALRRGVPLAPASHPKSLHKGEK